MYSYDKEFCYPVAEIFTSPQGEGLWAGTLMMFVRMAGCTVGRPFPKDAYEPQYLCKNCSNTKSAHDDATFKNTVCYTYVASDQLVKPVLPIYTEQCTTYDGRKFACDTDYKKKLSITTDEILAKVPTGVHHICITGGEPMNQPLRHLVKAAARMGIFCHIETSGTVPLKRAFDQAPSEEMFKQFYGRFTPWITVSPKWGVLDEMIVAADEIKLLIDKDFSMESVPALVKEHKLVYVQPINGEFTVDMENVQRTLHVQEDRPDWRICIQLHKILNVR